MKISTEILRGLNACASGYRDFKKAHEDKEILFSECVASGSNSISDYLWFIGKQDLSPSQLKDVKLFTIWCAESCLSVFEAAYPNDNRPREAIDASKRYLTDPTDENAYAARAAADVAYADVAYADVDVDAAYAARAAAAACCPFAYAARAAADAAAYAADAAARADAADAADADADAAARRKQAARLLEMVTNWETPT